MPDNTQAEQPSGPIEMSLAIEGMTCAGCEVTVTKSLETVPGVVVTDVDHQAGQATARVPEGTDGELLRQAVEDLGYTVTDIETE